MDSADPLLLKARAEGARLAAAEREALVARADYHAAVRRLHLAGASFREIADALGLSHQRVQQIVSTAGGSWWRRTWRRRGMPADAVCTWCGRPPADVDKLVAGPRVYICDRCVAAATTAAAGRATAGFVRRRGTPLRRCSFCRRRASHGRELVGSPAADLCTSCLRTCREIMESTTADAS
ncbi:MAG TPA: ClpX C4-type zinc finger protein [Vicinamibacterales bacterium]|nr:ClpX C4-type zinc finger protein [Vicinamibacterales bacterium]